MSTKAPRIIGILVAILFFAHISIASALTFSPVRYEINGNPGQALEKEMTLSNEGDSPLTLYSTFKNFEAEGESGTPSFTRSDTGLSSWLRADEKVTIPAKTSITIPFQVYIPVMAEPGGYFAAVLWSATPPAVETGQVSIGVETGPIVLLTVNGDAKEAGGIIEFGTEKAQKFYISLPVSFFYRFRNDGNDRIKPVGTINIKNIFGLGGEEISANKVEGNILPNSTRRFQADWARAQEQKILSTKQDAETPMGFFESVKNEWHNFAFGHYTAKLHLSYGNQKLEAERSVSFWVLPWHLLLVILVLLILIWWLGKKALHGYNTFIIKQATMALQNMEEGREERGEVTRAPREKDVQTLNLRTKKRTRRS